MQAVLGRQGTGDAGHGRTVERVGDQLRVTFGNGMLSPANLDRMFSDQDSNRHVNVLVLGPPCYSTHFVHTS